MLLVVFLQVASSGLVHPDQVVLDVGYQVYVVGLSLVILLCQLWLLLAKKVDCFVC